jgi:hypothetical protein
MNSNDIIGIIKIYASDTKNYPMPSYTRIMSVNKNLVAEIKKKFVSNKRNAGKPFVRNEEIVRYFENTIAPDLVGNAEYTVIFEPLDTTKTWNKQQKKDGLKPSSNNTSPILEKEETMMLLTKSLQPSTLSTVSPPPTSQSNLPLKKVRRILLQ